MCIDHSSINRSCALIPIHVYVCLLSIPPRRPRVDQHTDRPSHPTPPHPQPQQQTQAEVALLGKRLRRPLSTKALAHMCRNLFLEVGAGRVPPPHSLCLCDLLVCSTSFGRWVPTVCVCVMNWCADGSTTQLCLVFM